MDIRNESHKSQGLRKMPELTFFRMSALFRILHQIGINHELSAYF